MKQNMKRLLLLLSMITCFFVLSGCAKTEDSGSEEVTAEMEETLVNGSSSIWLHLQLTATRSWRSRSSRQKRQRIL